MPDRSRAPTAAAARVLVAAAIALAVALGGTGTRVEVRATLTAGDVLAADEQHLLVSEVMTGGASAWDEFIELYNPGLAALPLEGLEVVYATASGLSVSRRAAWPAGSSGIGAGRHVLIANEAGIYAGVADVLYASGMAETGGSVALRIQGAAIALDAVGWGTASSGWMEGSAAAPPAPGESIERLPGGGLGSTQDSGDNLADFVVRQVPDPQNSTSPPAPDPTLTPSPSPSAPPTPPDSPTPAAPMPSGTPDPSPSVPASQPATALPTPSAMPSATPISAPTVISVAEARALPDGGWASVRGVALTESDFGDGGGYVADVSGGIAVLLSGGTFARGDLVLAGGSVDDRFHQRTLRVAVGDLSVAGQGADPVPLSLATGAVDESHEGRLVTVAGRIIGSPTSLTSATAFDLDDGSGAARIVVGVGTGIDVAVWAPGAHVSLVGVVGQRDSSGTGSAGYRIQPRVAADVRAVLPPASPTSVPSQSAPASPGSSATAPAPNGTPVASDGAWPLVSIAQARAAGRGAQATVSGVVTLGTGTIDADSAVLQDATGAILLRLAAGAGELRRGQSVEVRGIGSTKAGMATLRVTEPAIRLGGTAEPAAERRGTGEVGEAEEAMLVITRGALVTAPRRASSGTVSLVIDDGGGQLRVVAYPASGAEAGSLARGSWIEVRGVVGQETTGDQPLTGYRIWLRGADDLRLIAAAVPSPLVTDERSSAQADGGDGPTARRGGLEALLQPGAREASVVATLVGGPWPEIGLAGVLWDGVRAVGITDDAATRAAVLSVARGGLPAVVRITARTSSALHRELGLPLTQLDLGAGLQPAGTTPIPAALAPPVEGAPLWVRVSGFLQLTADGPRIDAAADRIPVEERCTQSMLPGRSRLMVAEGLGLAAPPRLVLGCGGLRPAPTLTVSDGPLGTASVLPLQGKRMAAAHPSPGVHASRMVAMGLLATVLVMLTGGALVWWRRLQSAADSPSDEDADRPGTGEDPGATHLTLVELPRERGSP